MFYKIMESNKRMDNLMKSLNKSLKKMSMVCPSGEILRKSYDRVSKSGLKVHVKKACIKDQGKPGRQPMAMPLKKVELKCRKGEIARASYQRSAYIKKDGTQVKSIKIKEVCIKDQGKSGRGPRLIPKLEKGDLKKFGYSSNEKMEDRMKSLHKAVKEYGKNSVIRKLNAISILSRNTNKKASDVFHKDMLAVQKM